MPAAFNAQCVAALLLAWSGAATTLPPAEITGFDANKVYTATGYGTYNSALLWFRCPRTSSAKVRIKLYDPTGKSKLYMTDAPDAGTDYTGKFQLTALDAGTHYQYVVKCAGRKSERGSFKTPPGPDDAAAVTIAWVADMAGQGWGRWDGLTVTTPEGDDITGGFVFAEAVSRLEPDAVLLQGDVIYADGPINATQAIGPDVPPDALEAVLERTGSDAIWTNTYTKNFTAVALEDYWLNWRYQYGDDKFRHMLANHMIMNEWDDHEVTNNWYPGEILDDERYNGMEASELAAVAKQAMYDYLPLKDGQPIYRKVGYGKHLDVFLLDMRSYRDANPLNANPEEITLLGTEQEAWLTAALRESTATWKIIAMHAPVGINVGGDDDWDSWAQGDDAVLGRELQLARVLKQAKHDGVTGMHMITADVHYQAIINYEPSRATFKDFVAFSEIVIGPVHAGAFGPNDGGALDGSFGPEYEWVSGPGVADFLPEDAANMPPPVLQAFGVVKVSEEGHLRFEVRDISGKVKKSKEFPNPDAARDQ